MIPPGERPVFVGTSGYSYPEWKGLFYPHDLPAREYLRFYADHFNTTEINNTFYRLPSESTTTAWGAQVPDEFRFSIKLTQRITHQKKLADIESEMERFQEGIRPLGSKVAAVLVQLPPYFRKDLPLLSDFLVRYGPALPLAFEFRHASWQSADVYALLAEHGAPLVGAETDENQAVREATGKLVYIRLRKTEYAEGELEAWAEWIQQQTGTTLIYLKHDVQAPVFASRLLQLLSPRAKAVPTVSSQS